MAPSKPRDNVAATSGTKKKIKLPTSAPQTQSHVPFAASLTNPGPLYASATLLRVVLLLYGLWQDAHSPIKYTDIDYLVFTDAARFVARGSSPYTRETYRYTPLLAWLLLPTATETASPFWSAVLFSSGKILFAVADLVAGWLIERVLRMGPKEGGGEGKGQGMSPTRARAYAAIWLLNPMVATISTRGSSEGVLGVLVMTLLWAVLARKVVLAGIMLGLSVHFKIYPFIYAPAIVWWMDAERMGKGKAQITAEKGQRAEAMTVMDAVTKFFTVDRITLAAVSLGTFIGLNILMFAIYGAPFLTHTYLHHVTRIDHRHNFSPYNTLLYLTSAGTPSSGNALQPSSLAFLPQLLLCTVLLPVALAKRHLPTTLLTQTFAFATFNKVCTSQYFLWYLVLLPLYLPSSSFLGNRIKGFSALAAWVGSQAVWLAEGYGLEFLGRSTFVPGLWSASLCFFGVNCWILGVIIGDVLGSGG